MLEGVVLPPSFIQTCLLLDGTLPLVQMLYSEFSWFALLPQQCHEVMRDLDRSSPTDTKRGHPTTSVPGVSGKQCPGFGRPAGGVRKGACCELEVENEQK